MDRVPELLRASLQLGAAVWLALLGPVYGVQQTIPFLVVTEEAPKEPVALQSSGPGGAGRREGSVRGLFPRGGIVLGGVFGAAVVGCCVIGNPMESPASASQVAQGLVTR